MAGTKGTPPSGIPEESLTDYHIRMAERYGAHNYKPLPVVFREGKGIWLKDVNGKRYFDMLGVYSAASAGHSHPKILDALIQQAQTFAGASRAAYSDQIWKPLKMLSELTGLDTFLPMNTGGEGVETALKGIRKFGREVLKVRRPGIVLAENFFHGRMLSVVTNSTDSYQSKGYGPKMPGFTLIPFNDLNALEDAFKREKNLVAFMVEPIQGEAGVIIPDDGYLKGARALCTQYGKLLVLDEVQTGIGRTGKMFCYEHEGITPDMLILGKALGGGLYPVSVVGGTEDVMSVFTPGSHGSTFGGNPIAMRVAEASLQVTLEEKLPERAAELGPYALEKLREIQSPLVKEVRGKGLLMALELKEQKAHDVVLKLLQTEPDGIFCKDTHQYNIRFAPPLIITKEELDMALHYVKAIFDRYYS